MKCVSIPRSASRWAVVAAVAIMMASWGHVRTAQANNWVGPAIVGAIIGGAIAHSAYRHRHYHKRYHHKRYAKRYRRVPPPPVYYAPAVVIPLPFVYFGPPRW